MKIYNTLTRKVEEFIPNDKKKVNMYTCGPTVYHYAHIGNLRSYIMEDILEKTLIYNGYNVNRVMNITDVGHLSSDSDTGEDKMVKSAKKAHKSVLDIAKFYTEAFFEDFKKLNIKKPETVEPATNLIDDYIHLISVLLEKGYAYVSGGNVYFDTSKLDDYYVLTNHKEDEMVVGVREGVESDSNKRNQADFVLWFTKSKFEDQEQKWDSPWGPSYPGWHIECSAMSTKYLGEEFDIHTGGIDLVPTHHENEIAQNKGACGKNPAHYWIHGEYLLINGGKMSKSLGNTYLIDDIIARGYSPLAYRLFNYSCHYRGKLNFTWEGIESANTSLIRLREGYQKHLNGNSDISDEIIADMENRFHQAINDDMNMPLALSVVWEAVKYPEKSPKIAQLLKKFDTVLGIKIDEVQETKIPQEILDLVEERKQARSDKNWSESDRLRDLIAEKGYIVKDTKDGTEVLKK